MGTTTSVESEPFTQGCCDLRAQVRNTQLFPFSAVGELTGQLGTSNRGLECTGTLIGPKHVVGPLSCPPPHDHDPSTFPTALLPT